MQKIRRSFAAIMVSLFAVGALTFGASEVLAENAALACPYNPPAFLGECASQDECQTACVTAGGIQGSCTGGCCRCFL